MARTFGSYSTAIPAGITWIESFTMTDADGVAQDLSDYNVVRAHLRRTKSQAEPSLELTTAGGHFTIASPATGVITLEVSHEDVTTLLGSSTGKVKYFWSVELRNENVDPHYVIPLIKGKVTVEWHATHD